MAPAVGLERSIYAAAPRRRSAPPATWRQCAEHSRSRCGKVFLSDEQAVAKAPRTFTYTV